MRHSWSKLAMATVAGIITATCFASTTFNVHNRVGNGWHMYSTVSFEGNGALKGTTTLKNYNNFFGFTGGVFVVALDSQNNAVYATSVMKYGINAAGFRRKRVRTVSWSAGIPEQYLAKVNKIAVMQVHSPSNRVWKWVYNNRHTIINHAKYVGDTVRKIQAGEFTADDAFGIIGTHLQKI